jgi:hypothetical protein
MNTEDDHKDDRGNNSDDRQRTYARLAHHFIDTWYVKGNHFFELHHVRAGLRSGCRRRLPGNNVNIKTFISYACPVRGNNRLNPQLSQPDEYP